MFKLYIAALAAFTVSVAATAADALPEAPGATIGYESVAKALEALRARHDVSISVQGGWTLVDDTPNKTLWSFSPPSYAAYPAAVKREIREEKGGIFIAMNIACEASKPACDQLVVDFQKLNETVKQNMAKRQ